MKSKLIILTTTFVILGAFNVACNRDEELDVSPEALADFVFQPSEKIDEELTETEIDEGATETEIDEGATETEIDAAIGQSFAEPETDEGDHLDDGDATSPESMAETVEETLGEKRKVDFAGVKAKAEKGDAAAQCELGYYYETGLGVERDWKEAFAWYEKSANQGHGDGLAALGVCYQFGIGTKIDLKKAVELIQKGVEQDVDKAIGAMGYLLGMGFSPKKNLQLDDEALDVSEFQEFVRQRLVNHKDSDCPDVLYALSLAYGGGHGVEQNKEKCSEYSEKKGKFLRLEMNDRRAVALFKMGKDCMACPGNAFKLLGFELLSMAADQGLADAQATKGVLCYTGLNGTDAPLVEPNTEQAMKLLNLAAEQNHAKACAFLGHQYYSGKVVPKDLNKALEYFKKSEEFGEGSSYMPIAECYRQLNKESEFERYLDKAVEMGDPAAKFVKGCQYVNMKSSSISEKSSNSYKGYMLIYEAADAGNQEAIEAIIEVLQLEGQKPNEYRNAQFLGTLEIHINELRNSGKTDLADEYQKMWDQYVILDSGADINSEVEREIGQLRRQLNTEVAPITRHPFTL